MARLTARSGRRRRRAVVALAGLLALGGCGGGGDGGGDDGPAAGGDDGGPTVVLRNVKFEPERISVSTGQTVTWVWQDGAVQHDVASENFKSKIQTAGTFTHTFSTAGTFDYICTVHPNMKGVVEVT